MDRSLLLVFTSPKPGQEAEYHRWYEQDHLADILALRGFAAARRYDNVQLPTAKGQLPPTGNLALYEIEGDPLRAVQALYEARPTMNISVSLDDVATLWAFAPRPK